MNRLITIICVVWLLSTGILSAQNISVESFTSPLEISDLLGGDLQIDIKYTSQAGSPGNNLYIGLEELDENNQFVRTIDGTSLENEPAGTDVDLSVNLFVGTIQPLSSELPSGHYYQIIARLYTNTWAELASAGHWNTPMLITQNTIPYNFTNFPISKGADISWMTEMESQGYTWKDNDGNPTQLMPLLKDYDLDAVRLRVWVDPDNSPANGWCDIQDVVTKAQLAEAEGLDIMICIHYSDHWADPGKQNKPAAWTSFTVTQLETAVADHTTDILNALDFVNITPRWVQIGNETDDGMLWNTGKASLGNFSNYASFINAGANAVKSFNLNIKTILHISNGYNQSLYDWNISGLLNNGLNINDIDIIGMSLYPEANNWKTIVDQTYANMLHIQNTYAKEVMLVEIGFYNDRPDITYQLIVYMIEKTRQAQGLGVLYWEPIGYSPFTSYAKGAWDTDGSPSVAMDAFLDSSTLSVEDLFIEDTNQFSIYPNPASDYVNISSLLPVTVSLELYTILGEKVMESTYSGTTERLDLNNLSKGIYILKIGEDSFKVIKR
jgi:arabinogalactan endo-1,4-beta-galactosidase